MGDPNERLGKGTLSLSLSLFLSFFLSFFLSLSLLISFCLILSLFLPGSPDCSSWVNWRRFWWARASKSSTSSDSVGTSCKDQTTRPQAKWAVPMGSLVQKLSWTPTTRWQGTMWRVLFVCPYPNLFGQPSCGCDFEVLGLGLLDVIM